MLTFVQKMAALQPDIVFGDGEERSRDTAKCASSVENLPRMA